ncbi:hypothetical protein HCY66_11380 [Acinetobacter radioresistens]|uniref:hypothetical protein n=1 Tax=Acinetobacter radioresistens TaxID=40216 RepID=UPI0020043F6B|nr:hypothetical protein [Acinetobacter radioresistens]MCK4090667.1 hypothetical protein [Acinetobacter radioresistens]
MSQVKDQEIQAQVEGEAVPAPKKRTTKPKTIPAVDPAPEEVVVPVEEPAVDPAPEEVVVPVEEPAVDPAPEGANAPVKSNGFLWRFMNGLSSNQPPANTTYIIQVTNTGASSFEVYTRTPLPSGQTVDICCSDQFQRIAIIKKLNSLNSLAGKTRYIIKE